MNEKEVCTRIVNTFLDAGHEAFKIPDMPRTAGTKFNRVKGYDISASINYKAILIEAKIRKANSLPKTLSTFRKQFTPHQLKRFDRVTINNNAYCYAFVVLFKSSPIPAKRLHELYIVPWSDIVLDNYRPHFYAPTTSRKGLYQLNDFFNCF